MLNLPYVLSSREALEQLVEARSGDNVDYYYPTYYRTDLRYARIRRAAVCHLEVIPAHMWERFYRIKAFKQARSESHLKLRSRRVLIPRGRLNSS